MRIDNCIPEPSYLRGSSISVQVQKIKVVTRAYTLIDGCSQEL